MSSMMTSRLESLPNELLCQVEECLPTRDAVKLGQCNQGLCLRTKHNVYKRKDIPHRLMKYACSKNRPDLIYKAVSDYGVSLSTFREYCSETDQPLMHEHSTLCHSMLHSSVEACKALLELGARPADHLSAGYLGFRGDLHIMCQHVRANLGSSVGNDLFQIYVVYGFDLVAIRVVGRRHARFPMACLIEAQVPLDLIRLALDQRWPANESVHDVHCIALSAAVRMDNLPVFQLLLDRGASIEGTPLRDASIEGTLLSVHEHSGQHPTHYLPLYAAVSRLATAGPAKYARWVKACLDSGAQINSRVRRPTWYDHTPLHQFITSVPCWEAGGKSDPVGGLKLLLKYGASCSGMGPTIRWDTGNTCLPVLDLLLRKNSSRGCILQPGSGRLAAVKLLIDHGAARGNHAYLLAAVTSTSLDNGLRSPLCKNQSDQATLADLLVADVPRNVIATVLSKYLWTLASWDTFSPGVLMPAPVGAVNSQIVRALVARAGDSKLMSIPPVAALHDSGDHDTPLSVLHDVLAEIDDIHDDDIYDSRAKYQVPCSCWRALVNMVCFLVEESAHADQCVRHVTKSLDKLIKRMRGRVLGKDMERLQSTQQLCGGNASTRVLRSATRARRAEQAKQDKSAASGSDVPGDLAARGTKRGATDSVKSIKAKRVRLRSS